MFQIIKNQITAFFSILLFQSILFSMVPLQSRPSIHNPESSHSISESNGDFDPVQDALFMCLSSALHGYLIAQFLHNFCDALKNGSFLGTCFAGIPLISPALKLKHLGEKYFGKKVPASGFIDKIGNAVIGTYAMYSLCKLGIHALKGSWYYASGTVYNP